MSFIDIFNLTVASLQETWDTLKHLGVFSWGYSIEKASFGQNSIDFSTLFRCCTVYFIILFAQINSSFKLFLCSQLNSFHIVYFNNHSKFLIETYGSLSQNTSIKIWPTFYAVNSLISKAISSFNVWFSSNFFPITMIRIPLNWCLAVNASSFNPVVYVKCGTV